MKYVFAALLTAFSSMAAQAADTGRCHLEDEASVSVSGVLRNVWFTHPNGETYPALVLKLSVPFCAVTRSVEDDSLQAVLVDEMQVFPEEGMVLDRFFGKTVEVRGSFFGAHTAWHIRPIVFQLESISAR